MSLFLVLSSVRIALSGPKQLVRNEERSRKIVLEVVGDYVKARKLGNAGRAVK